MRHQIPQTSKIIITILLCVAIYMFGTLIKELYTNYQIEQYIENVDDRNKLLAEENESLQADLEYYTSERYKDKLYKQNLGLVNPGERVLIIKRDDVISNEQLSIDEQQASKRLQYYRELPNYKKWWLVLSG